MKSHTHKWRNESKIQVVGILREMMTNEKCNNFIMFYVQLITIKLTDSSPKKNTRIIPEFIFVSFFFLSFKLEKQIMKFE